jgi:hypothetical protein
MKKILTFITASALLLSLLGTITFAEEHEFSVETITGEKADYKIAPSFEIELDAYYGDFDTNGDDENDFFGIALDVYVKNISQSLTYGIAGIDARIEFDNTRLEPLFKTKEELNGIAGSIDPAPVYNFPTYTANIPSADVSFDLFSIDGLCLAYSHTDGGFSNPENASQKFSGAESYISCNYIINMDTHVAWSDGRIGLVSDDNVCFRYYFKVLESGRTGAPYVFTVPDSPEVSEPARSLLAAPCYTGDSIPFTTVTGKGSGIALTITADALNPPVTTVASSSDNEEKGCGSAVSCAALIFAAALPIAFKKKD